jgi:uncharacterized membrane protein YkvA (DUF1232 family)
MSDQPSERAPRDISTAADDAQERIGMLRGLMDQAVLSWRLFWDERVSIGLKLIPFFSFAYLFMPIDIVSELLIPVLGPGVFLDDIGIIMLGLTLFTKAVSPDIVKEHLREIRGGDEDTAADDEDIIDVEATPLD